MEPTICSVTRSGRCLFVMDGSRGSHTARAVIDDVQDSDMRLWDRQRM